MIKKWVSISIMFGLFFSSLYAQKIRFGLSIGFNEADARLHYNGPGTVIYDKKGFYSPCGGVVIDSTLFWKFTVHSGVLYVRKGFEGTLSTFGYLDVMTPINMRLGYLELPIVIKFNPIHFVHFGAGLYFAHEISKKVILWDSEDYSKIIQTKQFDMGYTITGGIEITILKKKHSFEARFSRGSTHIFKNYQDTYSNETLAFLYIFYF